jgi:hypothetical protein
MPQRGQADVEATIASLERGRFAAVVARDTAKLRQYLADDMTYTHSSGATETRDEFLSHLAGGRYDYRSIEPTELLVRVIGETAVIEGRARLVVGEDRFMLRFIDVWARRNGRWQMIAWQSTRLP